MLKCILTVGVPSSGKSTWAKAEVAKDPENWIRVNNDDLRAMANGSVFSADYEKFIADTRKFIIKEAFKRNKNVIIDNVNSSKRSWEDVCKIAKEANKDIFVTEKPFYLNLDELLSRDAARTGTAKVGEEVVKKFWKQLGGKQFAHYKAKVEVFKKRDYPADRDVEPIKQDKSLPRCVVFDNDGTISLLNGRNPYDASTCDKDLPHTHVIECMKLYYMAGYKIFFVSGRDEKDREPTEKFYKKHFPEVQYELYMRPAGNSEKDVIIKERIFNEHIKDKYYISGWFDDRLQIVKWLYSSGLPVFRVNDPEASF